jgi:predicted DNA binding protein
MSNKVLLVTPSDDVLLDGIRILLVDLVPEQQQIISDALTQLVSIPNIILYVWNSTNDINWLLDKKSKSDAIIFNADSENDVIIGYMAAQSNSHYFGTLKILSMVNNSTIYNIDQVSTILENIIKQHGLRRR